MQKLITLSQAKGLLCLHPNTIRKKINQGVIPYTKIGSRYYFEEDKLLEFIKDNSYRPCQNKAIFPDLKLPLDGYVGNDTIVLKGGSGLGKISKTRWRCAYGCIYVRETKQGLKRFYADYRDLDNKRKQSVLNHAQTPKEAFNDLKIIIRERYEPTKSSKSITKFREFAGIYLKDYAKVKKRSWKTDKSYLNANLVPYFGDYLLVDIKIHMIEKYQGKRLKDGVKKSTVNRELACLKKMFNKAIDWEFVKVNPVLKVEFFSEADNLKERVLSRDEERMLLETCPEHLKPIVITALQTGMRRREILMMKWVNINLEDGYLRVPKEVSKSGKDRVINFNGMLKTRLLMLKSLNGNSNFVFVNPKTGMPFQDIKKSFRGACERAGIEGLRFHDLRHTYATRLAEQNVPITTIKELLGHSKISMTERYTHSSEEQKKKAVELLHQWYTNPEISSNGLV